MEPVHRALADTRRGIVDERAFDAEGATSVGNCRTCGGQGLLPVWGPCQGCGGSGQGVGDLSCGGCGGNGQQQTMQPCPGCGGTGLYGHDPYVGHTQHAPTAPRRPLTAAGRVKVLLYNLIPLGGLAAYVYYTSR